MKSIELSLSPQYVMHWTINDALRELFQNALDQGKFEIEYKENTLKIISKGVQLDKSTLLLGKSSKDGKESIGKFGEGYKLALLVLARNGFPVTVQTWDEIWRPKFKMNPVLKAKTLRIYIETTITRELDTIITINNINNNIYSNYIKMNLFLMDEYPKHVKGKKGNMLYGSEHIGKIYVGGLYITRLPDFTFGYDFNPGELPLGRDRNIVSQFEVTWNGASMLETLAIEAPEKLIETAKGKCEDLNHLNNISNTAKDSIFEELINKYDEPVYFYNYSPDKEYKAKPVKLPSNLLSAVKGSPKYQKYLDNLDKEEEKTVESIMYEWLDEWKDHLSSKVIESFENYLIPEITKE